MTVSSLTHFPDKRPDEPLISVLARYHQSTGHQSFTQTSIQLFGNAVPPINDELPTRLDMLLLHMPYSDITFSSLINTATSLPYYSRFWSLERYLWIENQLRGPGGNTLRGRAGMRWISTKEHFCVCLQCVAEDRHRYGDPYWRRVHQLSGVMVCPNHPAEILQVTDIPKQPTRLLFITAADALRKSPVPIISNREAQTQQWLVRIARESAWLLNYGVQKGGREFLASRYTNFLRVKNLLGKSDRMRRLYLQSLYLDAIPPDILSIVGIGGKIQVFNPWPMNIVTGQENSSPLRHIITILALESTCQEVFHPSVISGKKIMDNFLCLNHLCANYKKSINAKFTKLTVRSSDPNRPSFIISCPECRFVYRSRESTERRQSVYMLQPGPLWEKKLGELAQSSSLAHACKELKVDKKTIKVHATRLNISRWKNHNERKPKKDISDDQIEYAKIRMLNPSLGRKAIRSLNPNLVLRLHKLSPEWIMLNQPEKKHSREIMKKNRITIDWERLDIVLEHKIYEEARKLIEYYINNPPTQRIGRRQVLQRLSRKNANAVSRSPAMLPKSSQAAAEFVDLHIRVKVGRIISLIRSYKDQGLAISIESAFRILDLTVHSPVNKRLYDHLLTIDIDTLILIETPYNLPNFNRFSFREANQR